MPYADIGKLGLPEIEEEFQPAWLPAVQTSPELAVGDWNCCPAAKECTSMLAALGPKPCIAVGTGKPRGVIGPDICNTTGGSSSNTPTDVWCGGTPPCGPGVKKRGDGALPANSNIAEQDGQRTSALCGRITVENGAPQAAHCKPTSIGAATCWKTWGCRLQGR